ncbi:MAG: hypothetical protein D6727_01115 [Gammaproteobacteria bacterium]|nr:MAG: hypothetical protein D6727_01115 [Gammaproteobacteria bacterium]
MTEHDDSGAGATAPAAVPADAPPGQNGDGPAGGQPGSGRWPAWLALALAFCVAAGSGYLWWQQRLDARRLAGLDELSAGLRELGARVDGNAELIDMLRQADERLAADLEKLGQELGSQRRALDELPLRIGRIERALENVPGVADKARSAWLLSEAAYYLRVANAQLQLARNPEVALRALELADQKLRDVADPALTRVRAVLADEITALKALPRPDAEGIALRLGSLGRTLGSLPLRREAPERFGQGPAEREGSGLERAWHAVRNALLSLVRIKRTDEVAQPLRTPEEEALLRRSLETELELARLALIRGEGRLYRDTLDGVTASLERYFDADSPAVQAALAQLAGLRGAELPESLPDISASLRLLLDLAGGELAQ